MNSCTNCQHSASIASTEPCRACLCAACLGNPFTKWTPKVDPHLVYVSGKGQPVKVHDSLELAKKEAERLAATMPNTKVYVVKVVATCKVETTVTTKWSDA